MLSRVHTVICGHYGRMWHCLFIVFPRHHSSECVIKYRWKGSARRLHLIMSLSLQLARNLDGQFLKHHEEITIIKVLQIGKKLILVPAANFSNDIKHTLFQITSCIACLIIQHKLMRQTMLYDKFF